MADSPRYVIVPQGPGKGFMVMTAAGANLGTFHTMDAAVAACEERAAKDKEGRAWIACDESCLGWAVFEVDAQRRAEIQRCDECDRFESDDAARAHVLKLAVETMGLRGFERWAEEIRHAELNAIAELRGVHRG